MQKDEKLGGKMIKLGYDAVHGINTAGKRTPDGEREWHLIIQ